MAISLNKASYSAKASKRAIKSRVDIKNKRLYLNEKVAKSGEYVAIVNSKVVKSDSSKGLKVNGQHFISLAKCSDSEIKALYNELKF